LEGAIVRTTGTAVALAVFSLFCLPCCKAQEQPAVPAKAAEQPAVPAKAEEQPAVPVKAEEQPPVPVKAEEQPAAPAIVFTNYAGGETIRYPVPLIRGALADKTLTSVEVINQSSNRDTAKMVCLAYDGRFKALTELVPGKNQIVIRAGKDSATLELTYKPQTNPYVTRIVYAVDSTGDTTYQTPFPKDAQDYAGKLGTMMLMKQTFTAERLNDLGMGRRTFNLELDEKGKVKIHILKCDKTAQEIYTMGGGRAQLYSYISGQLNAKLPDPKAKNVVITGFSRFNPETLHNMAYTALGSGNLALFGGSNMYCYPDRLADVQKAFMDATLIDTTHYSSDSAGRHRFWANASTSIGASLHELGHAFGLPHCRDGFGIMSRGFDFFSRFWVLQEAPAKDRTTPADFEEQKSARWTLGSAAFLRASRWFSLDAREYGEANRIQARPGDSPDEAVVESPDGVGAVCLGAPGSISTAVPMDYSKPAPTAVVVNTKQFEAHLRGAKAWLRIIDVNGFVKNVYLKDLRAAPAAAPAATQKAVP
jgi:hypothetical protein